MTITSTQNPSIKLAKQLLSNHRARKKNALTVIEGTHLLDACLQADYPISQVLVATNAWENEEVCALISQLQNKNITPLTIDDKLYQEMKTLGNGIDIMAIIPVLPQQMPAISNQDCLVLNAVQDSGNVGTLLRTAAAVGINHIVCTTGTAQVWSPKALRAGMGASFSLNIYENISIDELLDKVSVKLLATSSHTPSTIYQADLIQPVAWVMGHEGQGVCDAILNKAQPITIPQPNGQESLNVAIAGALCMYESLRQRHYAR